MAKEYNTKDEDTRTPEEIERAAKEAEKKRKKK